LSAVKKKSKLNRIRVIAWVTDEKQRKNMQKRLFSHLRNKFTIGLATAGVIIWLLHVAFPLRERLSAALEHLGLSILITTIVAAVLNYFFESAIRHAFQIIKGAEAAGICRIFPERTPDGVSRILAEAERATCTIDILAIAGTDFFHESQSIKTLLNELERRLRTNNNLEVRVLLLHPLSLHAIKRAMRENSEDFLAEGQSQGYRVAKLPSDILTSIQNLEALLRSAKSRGAEESRRFRLTVRLYNEAPKVMYVRTDDRVFAEPFLDGIPSKQKNRIVTKCLGKAVPVIEAVDDCEYATVLRSHFTNLWTASEAQQIAPGSLEIISRKLHEFDFAAFYSAQLKENNEMLSFSSGEEKTQMAEGSEWVV
jgi:uncharacterized membrane protein